jgi:hypothetical protein
MVKRNIWKRNLVLMQGDKGESREVRSSNFELGNQAFV